MRVKSDLHDFLREVEAMGRMAAWSDLPDLARLDERVSIANVAFRNVVGVNEGYIEWCPNDRPPKDDEALAWLWVVRPELGEEIAALTTSQHFRTLIREYAQAGQDR
jgi:hypothetical protein